MKNMKIEN